MKNELAIVQAGQTFLRAFNLHQPDEIADCFVVDGQIMPSYCHLIEGREAIGAFWQGIFGVEPIRMERRLTEIEVYLERAFEIGDYVLKGNQDRILDHGKYLVVWRQIEGQWKRCREIWNSGPRK